DLVFPEDNRAVAAQIVQLSFDFARADASLGAKFQAGSQIASAAIASGSAAKLAHFAELENRVDLASQQANQEVETIKKKLVTARGTERRTLQAALDVTQRRLDLLLAGLASLRELVDFVQVTAGRQTDLTSSIEELARTVPEVTNPAAVTSKAQNSEDGSLAKPRDSGILGLARNCQRSEENCASSMTRSAGPTSCGSHPTMSAVHCWLTPTNVSQLILTTIFRRATLAYCNSRRQNFMRS